MATPLPHAQIIAGLSRLPSWGLTAGALHARHRAPDVPSALTLLTRVFEIAEDMNHHPDADLRYTTVRWRLSSHDAGGVTDRDLLLAPRIDDVAAAVGATVLGPAPRSFQVAVDTTDPDRLAGFWAAALGAQARRDRDGGDVLLEQADGLSVFFQRTRSPASPPPLRNRLHIDVYVTDEEVSRRREAMSSAGGRLVSDAHAPSWWVYADDDGNEVCLCTDAPDQR